MHFLAAATAAAAVRGRLARWSRAGGRATRRDGLKKIGWFGRFGRFGPFGTIFGFSERFLMLWNRFGDVTFMHDLERLETHFTNLNYGSRRYPLLLISSSPPACSTPGFQLPFWTCPYTFARHTPAPAHGSPS